MDTLIGEALHSALQAPLYHLLLECFLVLWIIRLVFFKSYKISSKVRLTEKEKDDLISDWEPEPLVPPLEQTMKTSKKYRLVSGRPGKMITVDGKTCLNFASMNFLGLLGNKRIEEKSEECIRHYGVGSCGPRGFYGTIDVHLELEDRLAKFMRAEKAIIYSYGFATIASAIPAYSKRGDILYVDEAVSFPVQKGIQASRSKVVYFKHNDMDDLEEKLQEQARLDKKNPKKASVTRKFMVVEGIYMNTGELVDLPRLVDLKYKYKVRLIVEESLSFGVLGDNGRGITEHYDIPMDKVDMVCASLEYSLGSIGGFCCGRSYVINHQVLSGQGYVFSASLPPVMSRASVEGLNILEEDPDIFSQLRAKASKFQNLLAGISSIEVFGYHESASFHIKRANPVSIKDDTAWLEDIVEKSSDRGLCLTVASRLSDEELNPNWPPSIRVSVSVQMNESDLQNAAGIIQDVAQ